MSFNDDQANSLDYEYDENKLTKKKVLRTLGKRTYKQPISRRENING
jgi:hypothetical protein